MPYTVPGDVTLDFTFCGDCEIENGSIVTSIDVKLHIWLLFFCLTSCSDYNI